MGESLARIFAAALLVGVLAFVAWRYSRPSAPRKEELKKGDDPDQTSAAQSEPGETQACVVCRQAVARRQAPTIRPKTSLLDLEWLDSIFRWLGLRRETKWVLVLEQDLSVPETLCQNCYMIARSECEVTLSDIAGTRSKRGADEAQLVAEFLAHGLYARVEARTAAVRKNSGRPSFLRGPTQGAAPGTPQALGQTGTQAPVNVQRVPQDEQSRKHPEEDGY